MQAGGGGGNGLSKGGGLARYRSAPATWLEALLEEDENDVVVDPPAVLASSNKPPLHPPVGGGSSQPTEVSSASATATATATTGRYAADLGLLDSVGSGAGGLSGLLRQNSSPAEFLSDGYFSSFGIPTNYDYLMSSSPALDVSESSPSSKRLREADSNSAKASSTVVKGEQGVGITGLFEADMDKLAEDSVLCRVRAKRGCATHPRSIAERVRRTRISDRIRKLQELVPNMDKQTNTADMLEEAVEYVKFLQKQIQELTEQQKKCTCFTKE